jgi:hypothetical protein
MEFYNGNINSGDPNENGIFTANVKAQYLVNGTWTDVQGWEISPAYATTRNAGSGQTYTFTGSALPATAGIRIVGQVHTNDESWAVYVKEVKAYTGGGSTPPPSAPNPGPTPTTGTTTGTGYYWRNLTALTDNNTAKTREDKINDGVRTSTGTVNLSDNTIPNSFQAAGIIWTSAKTGLTSVKFQNGVTDRGIGGWFEGNVTLQYTTNGGTSWTNSGWSVSPAYPNTVSASNVTYTFSGTALPATTNGVRVIGKVRTNEGDGSWAIWVAEIEAFAGSTKISSVNEQQLQLNQTTVADKAITVYPNPVTDGYLTVGLNAADVNNKVNVTLSDLSGRIVFKDNFISNGISQRLNLGTIQPGIYVIRVTGQNTRFSSKVTVQ